MKTTIHAHGIDVLMFVGICDFEYTTPQRVVVDVDATGDIAPYPDAIHQCLDYSKVCAYVHGWKDRKHVDLIETLLCDVMQFCFEQDIRIDTVAVTIKKPDVIHGTDYVGVSVSATRDEFMKERQ